jgi:hypothetical protein
MSAINPALADKYEIVGVNHDTVVTSYGTIQFSKLSDKYAEELIRQGCPFIRRKAVKAAEPEPIKEVEQVYVPTNVVVSSPRRRKKNVSETDERQAVE